VLACVIHPNAGPPALKATAALAMDTCTCYVSKAPLSFCSGRESHTHVLQSDKLVVNLDAPPVNQRQTVCLHLSICAFKIGAGQAEMVSSDLPWSFCLPFLLFSLA